MATDEERELAEAKALVLLAKKVVPEIEALLGFHTELNHKVAIESALKAFQTLHHTGIDKPNEFKQAGHFAFWIRKLKPLRVVDLRSFQNMYALLREKNLLKGTTSMEFISAPPEPPPEARFINEIFAIFSAIGIIRNGRPGCPSRLDPPTLNDLIVNLRYHSYSPSAVGAIIESRVG